MTSSTSPPNRTTTTIWRRRLAAAMRIAAACITVAVTTLYGPHTVRRHVAFPAFSYVTAVLIVSEATLGDTLRGTWQALIGTSLVMGPSVLSLWLVRPERFTPELAALAVALGAFAVALAESTPILAKRLAFGQMVIVYVGVVVLGVNADVVMHPLHVAASTALGAMSSVLAMLVPFPRLASYEVKRKCELFAENATERLNLFVKAIADEESPEEASDLVAEIKSLSEKASRLLQTIERYQDAMLWEWPRLRLLSAPKLKYPAERLQEVEMTLKGMEMALASYKPQNKEGITNQQLKDGIQRTVDQLRLRIEQIACSSPSASSTVPEIKIDEETQEQKKIEETNTTLEDLPVLFILQCMNQLKDGYYILKNTQKTAPEQDEDVSENNVDKIRRVLSGFLPNTSKQNVLFALKCSLSLGLAVLLGLTYTKQNGFWSGLTIAITFVPSRQATFAVTNARAQGTALGSVYGVIGYCICHNYGLLKLTSILPWVVFTTFLRHSKMYGEAGSISALIAGLLILGRKHYGTPTEFAIARLAEAFIGLSCFIIVEIIMRPERAAVLVKAQLSQIVGAVGSSLEEMTLQISQTKLNSGSSSLQDKRKKMKDLVHELERLVREAKEEPNFWFTPFPGDCYTTVVESVKRMADTLFFMAYSVEVLCLNTQRLEAEGKGYRAEIGTDIELLKRKISSALESIQEAMSPKATDGKEIQSSSHDIEVGKPRFRITDINKEEVEIILSGFLQHIRDLTETGQVMENLELKKQIVMCVGSIAFCMRSLVKETTETGKAVKEIRRRENL